MMHAVRMKVDQHPALLFVGGMVLVIGVILVWGVLKPPSHAYDDAYITYRYADNFRNGLGLVYNAGEWVLGTTTPLFALLLGTLGFVFADIEALGHWLGILSWMAAAVAAAALFWQAERPFTAITAMFFVALQPVMLRVVGMETTLVIALMLASAWAWFAQKRVLAAVLLAALFVTRADGVLWALLIGLEVWRRNGRLPWRVTLLTILCALPWFLYAQWRYGSFLPNSVAAKSGQTTRMAVAAHDSFLNGFVNVWAWLPTAVLILFGLFVLAGLWVILRDAHQFWYLPVWILAYLAVYSLLGVANFPWYFAPPVIMVTLIAAMGAGGLMGDGVAFAQSGKLHVALAAFALITSLLLAMVWVNQMILVSTQKGYKASYPPLAQWLAQNTPVDARAATIEIGVIGYLSQRPILDTMGLVSPEMTHRQVGWVETLAYAVSQEWPEYAVVLKNTGWDWVIDQWWFHDYYKPVTVLADATIYELQTRPSLPYQVASDAVYPVGFTLTGADMSAQQLQPGDQLELWLQLAVDQTQSADYQLTTYLIDTQTDERTAVTTVDPLNGGYRSSVWQPGEALSLPVRLEIPADLSPGSYRVGLFVYDPESGEGLPTTAAAAYPEVKLGWLRYGSPDDGVIENLVSQPVESAWQDGIRLEQLDLPATALVAGDTLAVGLHWRAAQTPLRDLTVFVHLLDEAGEIVAQLDERPFAGRFPTTSWLPDEPLTDQITIPLPPDLPSGTYGLRLGFYDENGRLPLLNGDGDYLQLSNLIQINQK
ncbi:MAG: hypothetical protein IAF02_10325 [Anaerolineae bacterium]|nr:hypothetical protein [Anaerolineae bacterium]